MLLCTNWLAAQAVTFSNNSLLNPGSGSSRCVVDMNGDFLDDVVRTSNTGLTIDYQQTDGSFTQNFFAVPFQNSPSWSICAGDIDNNGFNDLIFGGGSAVSFIKANDDGSAYTETLMPDYIFSQRSTFSDIDNDGNLDAFVCHDVDQSHPFRNDGNGNLILDQSLISTLDMPGNYAAIWTDYDNDGDQDLYMTKCKLGSVPGDVDRTNRMYQNDGTGNFTEVAESIGVGDNAQSWATVVEDFDNDGDMDMFVVNHDFANRFYRNNGDGTFTDIIASTGIQAGDLGAWEAYGADFNNDGYMDIMAELNNSIYYGNGDLTFENGTSPNPGGAVGDLNNDGFMDILAGGGNVFLNDGNDNNWFKLNTVGIESNKNGIGARVELHGAWGTQIREVRAGQSFSPMHSMAIHFGIGDATEIDKAVVKWPSGLITEIDNPTINTMLDVYETGCYLGSFTTTVNGPTTKCPNEMVELTAPDGYAYEWNNGSTDQVIQVFDAGNYTVTVTDAEGCIGTTLPIAINHIEETYPEISAPNGERACLGETLQLTALAEDPVWSDGQSGLSIDVTTSGTYFVTTPGVCIAELESNAIDITFLTSDVPEIDDITLPGGPQDIMVTAIGDSIHWYDDSNGDNLIATGNEFTAYVESQSEYFLNNITTYGAPSQAGGKLDNDGNGGLPSTGGHSYFNAFEPFVIKEVTVYVMPENLEGTRTINLVDINNIVLATKTFNLTQEGENVLELDFEVPMGNNYSLRCEEHSLFRNNSGVNYPYPLGDLGEITNSVFGGTYYYYFYNWKVTKESLMNCESEIIDVQLSVTAVDELDYVNEYKVFPNPASAQLHIAFEATQSAAGQLELMDALGRLIQIEKVDITAGANRMSLDVEQLAAGIYQLNLRAADGIVTRKVIIE